jgi:hypothetical protein
VPVRAFVVVVLSGTDDAEAPEAPRIVRISFNNDKTSYVPASTRSTKEQMNEQCGYRFLVALRPLRSTMFRKTLGTLFVLLLASVSASAAGLPPRDAINLSQVTVYNSPADIASWPVTTAITRLEIHASKPKDGVSVVFDKQGHFEGPTWIGWPPPDGVNNLPFSQEIQYTVWAVVQVNGQWYTSGFIEMWTGRASTGAPILSDFARNWAYDQRWGPMQGHQPQVGEQMGFFVSAGDARGHQSATSLRERSNVVIVPLPAGDEGVFTYPATRRSSSMDFDGDGRADLAVYRPSTGTGYFRFSGGSGATYSGGLSTDIPVPGDYDGDGRTDVAAFRPSTGVWYILQSSTQTPVTFTWGGPGDIPTPGDYDGDGKTDIAVFRPSTSTWYVVLSSTGMGVTYTWGGPGDIPVPRDYDGDGKTDVAVYRPSTGVWYIFRSGTATGFSYTWGAIGDIPVPGDYDGDGKTDIAVFRPSSGVWYFLLSGSGTGIAYTWGGNGDIPVPADFDGDGKTDIAVFRPSSGVWYIVQSSTLTGTTYTWGGPGDIPLLKP